MALGGKVGDAWIDIHARKGMNDTDIRRIAAADGKAYKDSFVEEMNKDLEAQMRKRRAAIVRAINDRDFDALSKAMGTRAQETAKRFNDLIAQQGKNWGIAGGQARMFRRIVNDMAVDYEKLDDQRRAYQATNNRQIADHLAYMAKQKREMQAQIRLGTEMAADTKRRLADEEKARRRLGDAMDEFNRKRQAQQTSTIAELILSEDDADKIQERIRRTGQSFEILGNRLRTLRAEGEITETQFGDAMRRLRVRVEDDNDRTSRSFQRLRSTVNITARTTGRLDRMGRDFSRLIGRMSGRGSRNNFLNFIGLIGQFGASVLTFPLRLLGGLTNGIADLMSRFTNFRSAGFGQLASGLLALGPLLVTVGGALAGVVVGVLTLATLFPMLVSAITLVGGALTVLVGALTVGLLGGLVVLLPLIGALLVGLGGAALVAKAFADNSEEAKKALSGFGDVLDELSKRAEPVMERVLEQVVRLEDEFESLGDVGIRAADGIASGFERFIDNLESPSLAPFLSMWGETIPRVVESLSMALADFSTGLISWLAPVLPYAEELADNIERGAERFSEWSSSAEGQNSISNWMGIAWEAAGKLWNTLVNIGDILFTIFTSATEGAGNDFLGWLEETTEKWGTFLKSEEGQEKMAGFWEDVKDFAGEVKTLVTQFVDTWNALDTETSRENFSLLLDAISLILLKIEEWGPAIEAAGSAGALLAGALAISFKPVIDTIDQIISMMEFLGLIEPPEKKFQEAVARMGEGIKGLMASPVVIGVEGPSADRVRAAADPTALAFGDAFSRSVTGIMTLGIKGSVKTTGEAARQEAERRLQVFGDIGVLVADAVTAAAKRGMEKGGGESVLSFTDAQKAMLESAGLDPQEFIDRSRVAAGLAAWQEHLVDGMTAGATAGNTAFGNEFVTGMGGFASAAHTEMFANGVLLAQGIVDGFGSISPQAATAAESLGTSVDIGLDTGLSQVAMTTAARMAEGVSGITLGANNMGAALFSRLSQTPQEAAMAMAGLPGEIAAKMSAATAVATTGASQIVTKGSAIGSMVPLAGGAIAALSGVIAGKMAQGSSAAATGASNIRSSGSNIGGMVSGAASAISGLAGAIGAKMSAAWSTASAWAAKIRAIFASVQSANTGVSIGLPRTAAGGVFYGASTRVIGEAGMEAVVPLNRNLATVDPAVRALSAFAQGKYNTGGERSLVISEGAIQVTTRVADPVLVAESMLDRLVGNVVPG